jgi:murein DD-endopeptidase MepM/ murein hydrolase activator NlpD
MINRPTLLALTPAMVLAALLMAGCGGLKASQTSASSQANAQDALPPLKPHPRVVVALAPGEQPPPGAVTAYGSGSEAASFQPPSDAEVRAELGQLHAAKLAGSRLYTDPFSQIAGLTPERIDMGVDYAGTGPVVALGDGTVFNTAGPGWPGGIFIGIQLANGPYAGLAYFVAEDVKPTVRVGDRVRAGQEIGVMYHGPAGIETGWAAGHGDQPLASALGQQAGGDPGGWTSAAGLSFDRVLISTGTPSGIPQGTQVHGRMPAQYP